MNQKKYHQTIATNQFRHLFFKLITWLGLMSSFIFIFQMYWVTEHSYLDTQLKQLERNYLNLKAKNQKILLQLNHQSVNYFSEYNLNHLKKVKIKNIPIVEYR